MKLQHEIIPSTVYNPVFKDFGTYCKMKEKFDVFVLLGVLDILTFYFYPHFAQLPSILGSWIRIKALCVLKMWGV